MPRRFASVVLTVLLVALIFVVGVWVGGHPRQTGLDRLPSGVRDRLVDEDRTAIATQVLAILKDSYYKPLAPEVVKRREPVGDEARDGARRSLHRVPRSRPLQPVQG